MIAAVTETMQATGQT